MNTLTLPFLTAPYPSPPISDPAMSSSYTFDQDDLLTGSTAGGGLYDPPLTGEMLDERFDLLTGRKEGINSFPFPTPPATGQSLNVHDYRNFDDMRNYLTVNTNVMVSSSAPHSVSVSPIDPNSAFIPQAGPSNYLSYHHSQPGSARSTGTPYTSVGTEYITDADQDRLVKREDVNGNLGNDDTGDDVEGEDVVGEGNMEGDGEGVGDADDQEPLYVNAKQYHRIVKRRAARARLEELNRLVRSRKPYLHESRHRHACSRPRGKGGRFLTADEIEALKKEEAAKTDGATSASEESGQ